MIFKTAVSDYLKRPLRDLSRYKQWSEEKLSARLAQLDPQPKFITSPRKHQKVGFLLGVKYPHLFCMFDMGLGKSKLALDLIRYLRKIERLHRVLILVPNVVNLESWRMEITIHAPDLSATYIEGTKQDRREAWEEPSDLCLCTYAGLQALICTNSGKKRRVDPILLAKAKQLFDGAVFDESTALMNHRSLNFRVVGQLTKDFAWRVGLTGTPLGRDPHVLWAQFYCVDRGAALGETLGPFREAFFKCKEGYFGGFEYTFKRKMEPDLRRMMSHTGIRYASDECLDLPKKVPVEKPFVLTDEAWSYYSAVLEQAQANSKKLIDVSGIFVRLRQITSGFVSVEGKPSALAENPKLDVLMELLDELPLTEKVVIFNEFIYSGDIIEAALRARKMGTARLYSGTRSKSKELLRFLMEDDCRAFIVNSQSGAQGLNLQQASYVVFYESPVSPIVRQQAEKRCHRPGQEKPVFIYDLYARRTVEQKILRFLAEGRDLFAALVEGGVRQLQVR